MGIIARCEGNHDTVVGYDGTGVTWGFLQWTFTSGRLQKLLESLKSIPYYDFTSEHEVETLFDDVFCNDDGEQLFSRFGFSVNSGRFVVPGAGVLNPAKGKNKNRIMRICLGQEACPGNLKEQKYFAKELAKIFAIAGKRDDIAAAQVQFAKQEFKRALDIKRSPLGKYETIRGLLPDTDRAWELPIAALFFNLWQNSPAGSYRLFKNVHKEMKGVSPVGNEDRFLDLAWRRLNKTAYANWGWNSKRYLANPRGVKPRVFRIRKAIKEFYNLDLPFIGRK
jgi:hypothetical protein